MVKKKWMIILLIILPLGLAGCGSSPRNQVPPQETVPAVQAAVDRYILTHKSPPIKPRTGVSGEYERYAVDFHALRQTLQLSEVPANAYESGGPYYYVLLQEPDGWQVKLIDMLVWQTVTDIQAKADTYRTQTGRVPAAAEHADGLYILDAEALGLDTHLVRSVYSPQMLPLVITEDGTVVIDYAFEIMKRIQLLGDEFQPAENLCDLRDLLISESFMVPVHSLPYIWLDGEPVIAFEPAV